MINDLNLNNNIKFNNKEIQNINLKQNIPENNVIENEISISVEIENNESNIPKELIIMSNNNAIYDALKLSGFNLTPENIKMIDALIDNSMAVTKQNLAKLNQAMKLMDKDLGKAMFFLKNEMKINSSNSDMIKGYANQEIKILNQIEHLVDSILDSDNPKILELALKAFLGEESTQQIIQKNGTNEEILNQDSKQNLVDTILSDVELEEILTKTDLELQEFIDNKASQKGFDTKINNQELKQISEKFVSLKNISNEQKEDLVRLLDEISEENKIDNNNLNEILDEALNNDNEFKNIRLDNKKLVSIFKEIIGKDIDFEEIKNTKQEFRNNKHIDNEKQTLKEKIINRFLLKIGDDDLKDTNKVLNNLKSSLEKLNIEMEKNQIIDKNITNTSNDINKNLQFLDQMKDSIYLQIPISINNKNTEGELFVFKRNEKKSAKQSESISALLALDLAFLGHLETYMQKNSNTVSFQFRVENEDVEKIIKSNINILSEKLEIINVQISGCSYKQVDEPFNLTDKEPNIDQDDIIKTIYGFDFKA